jgi:cell shape-determining protein MreC
MSTKEILEQVKQLSMRINVLADMQMLVMEELGNKNPRFQAKAIANILSHDEIRQDFTEFIQTEEGMSDNMKVFMQDINEMIKDMREEE